MQMKTLTYRQRFELAQVETPGDQTRSYFVIYQVRDEHCYLQVPEFVVGRDPCPVSVNKKASGEVP